MSCAGINPFNAQLHLPFTPCYHPEQETFRVEVVKYRREIDGLRAIAVVPVVLFHAGFEVASGGFVGVDVFFVISGYLITTILLKELAEDRFSILGFYERRFRRILPALIFVILCCFPAAWLLMTPSQMSDFSQSVAAVSVFSSNFLFWLQSDYFAPAAETYPLLHTWSLAVEEQFYIIFPPFLYLAWRYGWTKSFITILVIAFGSLLLSEWGWRTVPAANFYLAPFRAWELLFGSIAAFLFHRHRVPGNSLLSAVGLAAILASILFYDESYPIPGLYGLLPVGGTLLIILFGQSGTITAKVLGTRVLVAIGLVSYSAYLWHQPILAFARIAALDTSDLTLMSALSVLSFALAAFSWRFIEQPFRGKRPFLASRTALLSASAVSIVAFAAIGGIGYVMKGYPDRLELRSGIETATFKMPTRAQGYCFYSFNVSADLPVGDAGHGCTVGAPEDQSQRRVLLFGDSYAAHWDPFWNDFGQATSTTVESITTNWCFPAIGNVSNAPLNHASVAQCEINRNYVSEHLDDYDLVILAGAWQYVEKRGFQDKVFEFIAHSLETSDTPIVIMDVPAMLQRESVERFLYFPNATLHESPENEKLSRDFWSELSQRFGSEDRVFLMTREQLFGATKKDQSLTAEDLPYSLDGGHISIYGATQSWRQFKVGMGFRNFIDFLKTGHS